MPAIWARKVINLRAGCGKEAKCIENGEFRKVRIVYEIKPRQPFSCVRQGNARPLKPHRKLQLLRIQHLVAQEKCSYVRA